MRRLLTVLILTTALIQTTYAHRGRTDSKGCHTNRKTGEYHCHNSGSKKSSTSSSNSRSSSRRSTSTSTTKKTKTSNGSLYFSSCKDAKNRGYTNIRKGQAGYRLELDPNKNGIACEPSEIK